MKMDDDDDDDYDDDNDDDDDDDDGEKGFTMDITADYQQRWGWSFSTRSYTEHNYHNNI